jgi:hypothetical protein
MDGRELTVSASMAEGLIGRRPVTQCWGFFLTDDLRVMISKNPREDSAPILTPDRPRSECYLQNQEKNWAIFNDFQISFEYLGRDRLKVT